jgi:hypothetical protein
VAPVRWSALTAHVESFLQPPWPSAPWLMRKPIMAARCVPLSMSARECFTIATGIEMKKLAYSILLALVNVATAGCSTAAPDHSTAVDQGVASLPQAGPGPGKSHIARMDAQMKSMDEMHKKMMTAATPAERNTLMAAHIRSMQHSIDMLMSPIAMDRQTDDMRLRHKVLAKQMEMMRSTMQIMLDCLPQS